MQTELLVQRMDPRARLPVRSVPTDSGFDLYALEGAAIRPGETVRVRTGIAVQIAVSDPPPDYNTPGGWTLGLFIWDRSGLASRGLKIGGGVLDNGYTGEIAVVVTNVGAVHRVLERFQDHDGACYTYRDLAALTVDEALRVETGDRIANVVVGRVELPTTREVTQLARTTRGSNGFGSTGR